MAITQAVCNSFKTEILTAIHDFTNGTGHTFKLALYTSSAAVLDKNTTAYATNPGGGGNTEVGDSGTYSAGGGTLTSATPTLDTDTAVCDFADISFTAATITARAALIYNSSATNKAVEVLDFGSDKTSTAGTFSIVFPAPDAANAILRLA